MLAKLAGDGENVAAIGGTMEKQGQGKASPLLNPAMLAAALISDGLTMAEVIKASPYSKSWIYAQPVVKEALRLRKTGRKSFPRGRADGGFEAFE